MSMMKGPGPAPNAALCGGSAIVDSESPSPTTLRADTCNNLINLSTGIGEHSHQSIKGSSDVCLEADLSLPPPCDTDASRASAPHGPSSVASPVSGGSTPAALRAASAQTLQHPASPGESAVATGPGVTRLRQPPALRGSEGHGPRSSADTVPGPSSSNTANTPPYHQAAQPGPAAAGPQAAPVGQQQHKSQADQTGLPKSPVTFDDLLPLLTSQHHTSSSNNDALMDLFDAFTRHGSGSFRPLAHDSTALSGSLRKLTSGLGSGGMLCSPLLRNSPLGGALARLESLGSQGRGGAMSPDLAALLTSNSPNRTASGIDWMSWPPHNLSNDTQGQAQTRQQQLPGEPLPQQQEQQVQVLGNAPSVDQWLTPSSTGMVPHTNHPAPAGAAQPQQLQAAAAAGAAAGNALPGPTSTTSLSAASFLAQDTLHLNQIHIGGEPLFDDNVPSMYASMAMQYQQPAMAHLAAGGSSLLWGPAGTVSPWPRAPPQVAGGMFSTAPGARAMTAEAARVAARAARQYRKEKLRRKKALRSAAAQQQHQLQQEQGLQPKGGGRRLYTSHAERLRAKRGARHAAENEARAVAAEVNPAAGGTSFLPAVPAPSGDAPASLQGMRFLPSAVLPSQGSLQAMVQQQQNHHQGVGLHPWVAPALPNDTCTSDTDDSDSDSDNQAWGMASSTLAPQAMAAGYAPQLIARRDTAQSSNNPDWGSLAGPGFGPASSGGPAAHVEQGLADHSAQHQVLQHQQQLMLWAQGNLHRPGPDASSQHHLNMGKRKRWVLNSMPAGPAQPPPAAPAGPTILLPAASRTALHGSGHQLLSAGPSNMQAPQGATQQAPAARKPDGASTAVQASEAGGGLSQWQDHVTQAPAYTPSLAKQRPRRQVRMTAAAAAAAALSDTDSRSDSDVPAEPQSASTKQGSRKRTADAMQRHEVGSWQPPEVPDDNDGSSSDFSGSEFTQRRSSRQRAVRQGSVAAAAASDVTGGTTTTAKPKRRGGSAAAVRHGKPSNRSKVTGSPSGRPVFDNTRSKYRGVTRHRRSGRWEAHIWIKELGRQVYLGGYDDEEAAAEAYDMAALKSKGTGCPTNFPPERYTVVLDNMSNVTLEGLIMAVRRQSQGFSRGSSTYRGVTAHPSGRWESRIGVPGSKHVYLGLYNEEVAAAQAYDGALVRFKGASAATNFSVTLYQQQLAEHYQMKLAADEGLIDSDILKQQSGPEFELFVKAGAAAFCISLSEAAWEMARADTSAGTDGKNAAGEPAAGTTGLQAATLEAAGSGVSGLAAALQQAAATNTL